MQPVTSIPLPKSPLVTIDEQITNLLVERAGIKDSLETNDKTLAQLLSMKEGVELGIKMEQEKQNRGEGED